jgi:hypothetical protein
VSDGGLTPGETGRLAVSRNITLTLVSELNSRSGSDAVSSLLLSADS